MGIFSSANFDSLEQLFHHQLKDLYDAEKRLVDALPKMAEKAHNSQLQAALREHLHETEGHVRRLEMIFENLGIPAERITCDAMKGLISEGEDILAASGDPDVLDAAIIAAAQRVEHYEIAAYGTARTFAERLGRSNVASMLQETLDEEGNTDHKLTAIATSLVNPAAAH